MNTQQSPFRLFVFLGCLAGLALSATASPTTIPTTAGATFKHEPSGFIFQPTIAGFQRVKALRYDERGEDISVGYNDDQNLISATVYIYPREKDDVDAHFHRVTDDIKHEHPSAVLISQDKATIQWTRPGGAEEWQLLNATFEFKSFFARQNRKVLSEAYLMAKGPHWLLIRITYPKDEAEAAHKAIGAFLPELLHGREK
jgi:hypothetical protein